MENKKKYLKSAILFLVASICFFIVTCNNFYNQDTISGFLCLCAFILDGISAIINFIKYKKVVNNNDN